jgi:broad specificity phosphatase PhoE
MRLELKKNVTLYFARHGETEANRQMRFSGLRDTPLTDKGREVGMRPALEFVCSPLQRARTTMEIVRETLGLRRNGYLTDPRIQEIDLGRWDQLTSTEARALDPALFDARAADKWDVAVPGGENYQNVAVRAAHWAESLTTDAFAVSHGALTRILRGLFLGLDWQGMSDLDEPQGVVFRVRGGTVTRLD